jgi:hypothetical protein
MNKREAAMTSILTGGCLCGRVRYEYRGTVGRAGYCHCADCRRTTGSAFNISVRLEAAGFRLTKGAAKGFTKTADSGSLLTRHFCADCGSPLYTTSPSHPDALYVKAGSLDDPGLVHPTHQSWMRSRVPWAAIDPDLPRHEAGGG